MKEVVLHKIRIRHSANSDSDKGSEPIAVLEANFIVHPDDEDLVERFHDMAAEAMDTFRDLYLKRIASLRLAMALEAWDEQQSQQASDSPGEEV